MLKDSEHADNGRLIAEVKSHRDWDSELGADVQDSQLHFMIQVMEAWFLADHRTLRLYYGQRFLENRLPGNPNVEHISKADVLDRLRDATRNTSKGIYDKTGHAPEILASIDENRVRSASPACSHLFHTLENLIS